MEIPTSKRFWQPFLGFSIALGLIAIYQTQLQTNALLRIQSRYKWVVVMGVFALNVIVGAYLLFKPDSIRRTAFWDFLEFDAAKGVWKLFGLAAVAAGFPLTWYVKSSFFGKALPNLFPMLWIVWWISLLQAAGFKIMLKRSSWAVPFSMMLLAQGVAFQTYEVLRVVTSYPFSLGWSEASRYYYASLLFSKSIYGQGLPLSIWHPTRYFLLSMPFLVQGLPLWAHRLWQAVLWLGFTGLTSWLAIRRLRLQRWDAALMLGAWFFLYLFQGAVYYHLQVCVMMILLGVSPRHPWRSLIAVLAASFWAGMSRLNWFPVPAMLAIGLYFLEEPFSTSNNFWRYMAKPAVWLVLGLTVALLAQGLYISWSGNQDLRAFSSSLTSTLLWYRLFPNPTNPLGILPGIALVSLPAILILSRVPPGHLHRVRWLGLAVMLLVLFLGGLVVSVKIGGGGDLHNMDAYMVLLALVSVYLMCQRIAGEAADGAFGEVTWPLIAFLLVVPVGFALSRISPPFTYDRDLTARELQSLREATQTASKSGPVLFIYERHLLTFGMIQGVPFVADYEVIALMEMALSGNQAYLNTFYGDLHRHRFAAIVARKQNLDSASGDFAEESDVWNRRVAYHLLCEYEPALTLESSNVQVFLPRSTPKCPQYQTNPDLP